MCIRIVYKYKKIRVYVKVIKYKPCISEYKTIYETICNKM